MKGGYFPQQLREERLGKGQNLRQEFEKEVVVLELLCYLRGSVSVFYWLEAHKEVHVLCIRFAGAAGSIAPLKTERGSPRDSIL